jgi:16S rRNA (cytidine1402-2'-O)-methyltransferase
VTRAAAPADGGILYVVATPIGNLADVTLRAVEVLRSVPLVAAEDTRLTRRLFARHGLSTRLIPFHARSGAARMTELLDHLRGGADLALVTDAGTPAGRVVPIPGASAVLAAVAASGIAGPRWSFEGFLPRSGRERRARLARLAADERGAVIFEAPGRLATTLDDLVAACGPDRPAAVCRELTKLHESIVRGSLGGLADQARSGAIPARGEMTIVLGWGVGPAFASERASLDDGRARVKALIAAGVGRSEAARRVAAETGIPRRQLYRPGE